MKTRFYRIVVGSTDVERISNIIHNARAKKIPFVKEKNNKVSVTFKDYGTQHTYVFSEEFTINV